VKGKEGLMKRYYVFGIVLTLLMIVAGPVRGAGEQGHPVVGTWVITVESNPPYDVLMSLHPDGTLLLSQSTEDLAGGCVQASTRQGVWEKDGPRGLIGTHIGFTYAEVSGECVFGGYVRYRWTAEVSKDDLNTATANLDVEFCSDSSYFECLNPKYPAQGFHKVASAEAVATRVTVIPPLAE
jgi:hypothetical protein